MDRRHRHSCRVRNDAGACGHHEVVQANTAMDANRLLCSEGGEVQVGGAGCCPDLPFAPEWTLQDCDSV
eukprot:12101476-Alexandrium_andersonii.AAC.1